MKLYSNEHSCGIYKITNKVNGKSYIGQSEQIEKRIRYHRKQGKLKTGLHYPLYEDMRKYGINNFDYEILEQCSIEKLNEKEKYWISFYNTKVPNGYNQTKGGDYIRNKSESYLIDFSKPIEPQLQKIHNLKNKNNNNIKAKYIVNGWESLSKE